MNSIPLRMTPQIWYTIQRIVISSAEKKTEISFLGSIEIDVPEKKIFLTEIYIPDQEGSSASSDMNEDALEKIHAEIGHEKAESIMFWGHTHPSGTSPSGTDIETFIELKNNHNLFIMAIFAKGSTANITIHFNYKPFPLEIPCTMLIEDPKADKIVDDILEERVKAKTYTSKYKGRQNDIKVWDPDRQEMVSYSDYKRPSTVFVHTNKNKEEKKKHSKKVEGMFHRERVITDG